MYNTLLLQQIKKHLDGATTVPDEFLALFDAISQSYDHYEHGQAEEQGRVLEQFNLMKSEFISNVSHELHTPLATIVGFAQTILQERELLGEMQRDFLDVILDEGIRLATFINDLLDMARIESGRAITEKIEADLVPIIHHAIDSVSMQANAKSLKIESDIEQGIIVANFDRDRISQAIFNLLSDSVKFTSDGGRINVTTRMLGSMVEIAVSDTRLGTPESDQPMLFQKVFRVHRSGLAMTREFVEIHDGTIGIESQRDKGSTSTGSFRRS